MRTLTPRQEAILNRVVDTHIETGQPVASKQITAIYQELYRRSYSSATVRYEMLHLEEQGYLTHPHTSSGRIPTDRGYRHYVDHGLREESRIQTQLSHQARQDLEENIQRLEDFVSCASRVLAELSGMASLLALSDSRQDQAVSFRGVGHFLEQEDFSNRAKLGRLLHFFEDRESLLEWLEAKRSADQIRVEIGRENGTDIFEECSVITSPVYCQGRWAGVLALIGSRRMRYAQAISVASGVAQALSGILERNSRSSS